MKAGFSFVVSAGQDACRRPGRDRPNRHRRSRSLDRVRTERPIIHLGNDAFAGRGCRDGRTEFRRQRGQLIVSLADAPVSATMTGRSAAARAPGRRRDPRGVARQFRGDGVRTVEIGPRFRIDRTAAETVLLPDTIPTGPRSPLSACLMRVGPHGPLPWASKLSRCVW